MIYKKIQRYNEETIHGHAPKFYLLINKKDRIYYGELERRAYPHPYLKIERRKVVFVVSGNYITRGTDIGTTRGTARGTVTVFTVILTCIIAANTPY